MLRTRRGGVVQIERVLGEGGQGRVYLGRLEGRPVCAKVLTRGSEEQLQRVLERAASLQETSLVLPFDLLEGQLGYVMPFAEGQSFDRFFLRYRRLVDSYRAFGLGQRLQACYDVATALQAVHRQGLAYLDLNGGNLLLGAQTSLIDCDNLVVCGTEAPTVLGRPWYMAPEVARGAAPPDPTTDLHSLAVLSFLLLLMRHPLIGDRAREGSPDEEARVLREGPYVHEGTANESVGYRLPLSLLTPRLQRLFRQTFVDGLHQPGLRVPASLWRDAFSRARDALWTCPHCRQETFFSQAAFAAPRCAWPHCGRELPRVPVLVTGFDRRVVVAREGLVLSRHHLDRPFDFTPVLRVGRDGTGWFLERVAGDTYVVAESRPLAVGERGVRVRDGLGLKVGLSGAPVHISVDRWFADLAQPVS